MTEDLLDRVLADGRRVSEQPGRCRVISPDANCRPAEHRRMIVC